MKIYIPSKARALNQKTWKGLTSKLRADTFIVVPPEDFGAYDHIYGIEHVLKGPERGIAPTRQFIFNHAKENGFDKIVMLDDDLIFQRLREDGKITNSSPDEVELAFAWLEAQLDEYAHAGFSVRFSDKGGGKENRVNGRMMHVLAYNLPKLPLGTSFLKGIYEPETFSMDDFNMTLQLLTQGVANIVSSEWRTSPSAGNAKGGASTWRKLETQNASARNLQELFPHVVALREKKNWQGVEGGQMIDVTVQWRRSYGTAR